MGIQKVHGQTRTLECPLEKVTLAFIESELPIVGKNTVQNNWNAYEIQKQRVTTIGRDVRPII